MSKGFLKLMLQGKVRQALNLVNANTDLCGMQIMNDAIRNILQEKLPSTEEAQDIVLDNFDVLRVDIIFQRV